MPSGSVLIVEDETIVAAHLSDTVKRLGYDVLEVVSSGTTAVTRVAQLKPDLVLMDITLDGDKDGVAAAQTSASASRSRSSSSPHTPTAIPSTGRGARHRGIGHETGCRGESRLDSHHR
jgi:CheY-like chemotaxis protein